VKTVTIEEVRGEVDPARIEDLEFVTSGGYQATAQARIDNGDNTVAFGMGCDAIEEGKTEWMDAEEVDQLIEFLQFVRAKL
jgi:hypothetical protein